ncbi:MAG: hypothetical protein ACM3PZ_01360 [Bacillota bacterium]
MNKKKIYISAGILLAIVAVLLLIFGLPGNKEKPSGSDALGQTKAPVLMTTEEKQVVGLQPETQVEVLGRDDSGAVSSYRILRDDKGYPLK